MITQRHRHIAIVGNGIGALMAQSVFQAEGPSGGQVRAYGDQQEYLIQIKKHSVLMREIENFHHCCALGHDGKAFTRMSWLPYSNLCHKPLHKE